MIDDRLALCVIQGIIQERRTICGSIRAFVSALFSFFFFPFSVIMIIFIFRFCLSVHKRKLGANVLMALF